ncbi:hypothetical protein CBM2610_A80453 [Cupriavidus taiwanensis]|nr:hypothetical protein CBM2610_A80453 [Cupriavidus taiwanensis]
MQDATAAQAGARGMRDCLEKISE